MTWLSRTTWPATAVKSNSSGSTARESLSPRARNSSCSTKSVMDWVSCKMASMASCMAAGSSLPQRLRRFAYPWMTAMGVRSSWEASETKRAWAR